MTDGIVLIHGAHHGAWVWDDVVPLLSLPSLAVDLPGRGGQAGRPATAGILGLDDLICSALAVWTVPAGSRLSWSGIPSAARSPPSWRPGSRSASTTWS